MDNQYIIDLQKITIEHYKEKVERLEKQIKQEYKVTHEEMLTALEKCWNQFADHTLDKHGFIIGREHCYLSALEETYEILLKENVINKEGFTKDEQNKKRHISEEI